ncbi:Imm1 family immunity protein [Kitasatospora aureofaciens]|uniref:Imm1 family immunity protein n=1 Tax=Kitasatospora aureofaciens TaxID=1894 RepID=UPI0037C5D51F
MIESWAFDDSTAVVSTDAALQQLRARIAAGHLESWLTSSTGRSLGIITNTERAMVLLLAGDGGPGEHAVDPGATGQSSGFILANGQHDEYPDHETIPLAQALQTVSHILTTGAPPTDAAWAVDR